MEFQTVRALYEAVPIPGNDTSAYSEGRMKVFFPASEAATYNTEVDVLGSPFPVILFLVGSFVESNRYQWLAERIVRELGAAFVLFDALSRFESLVLLGPVIGGSQESMPATFNLVWILDKLEELNEEGTLKGHLDLNRVVLGGHSRGASTAFQATRQKEFPNVVGMFLFGAHPLTLLLDVDDTPPALNQTGQPCPLLLVNGRRDGLVLRPVDPLGNERPPPIEALQNLPENAFLPKSPLVYVEMEGLNHYAIVDPEDTTVGTAFLFDLESEVEKSVAKDQLSTLFTLFARTVIGNDSVAAREWENALELGNLNISDVVVKA